MGADRDLRDEVDLVVEAWSRERPDLNVTPMRVLSRVTRLARHLDRQRAAAFSAHGLETWEFDVLAALRRAGPPNQLSPGQLLRETLVTSGTMTNRVDRLAARGLVRRDLHPGDKRGVLVGLTDAGRTAVDACLICRKHRGEGPLVGPVVHVDEHVSVSHRATGALGYVFVESRRHV